jgi:hypothetical protein
MDFLNVQPFASFQGTRNPAMAGRIPQERGEPRAPDGHALLNHPPPEGSTPAPESACGEHRWRSVCRGLWDRGSSPMPEPGRGRAAERSAPSKRKDKAPPKVAVKKMPKGPVRVKQETPSSTGLLRRRRLAERRRHAKKTWRLRQ